MARCHSTGAASKMTLIKVPIIPSVNRETLSSKMKRPGQSRGNRGPSGGVPGHSKRIIGIDGIDLERLTVDDLLALRDQVSTALASRLEAERRDLESRLARLKLADVPDSIRLAKGGRVIGGRAMVAPKYRNPDNPLETWSGRGRKPRWLTAALKAGRKLRDFKIVMLLAVLPFAAELIECGDIIGRS